MSDANNSKKPQVDPYWKAKLESLKALVKATAEVAEAKAIAAANAKAAIALVDPSELEAAISKEAAAAEEASA